MNGSWWALGVTMSAVVGCGGVVVFDDGGSGGSGGSGSGGTPTSGITNGVTNGVTTNVSVGVTTGSGGSSSAICVPPTQSEACGNCINARLEQGFCQEELQELIDTQSFEPFLDCNDSCGEDGPACCNACLRQFPVVEAPYSQAISCLACSQNCYDVCRPLSDALCFQ